MMCTTPIAKHVPPTNSCMRSTGQKWILPKQLKPVLTPAASFTRTHCLVAASMKTTWWSSVKHAARYVTSEINCFRHNSMVWWELWFELCCVYSFVAFVDLLLYAQHNAMVLFNYLSEGLLFWAHTLSTACQHVWPFHMCDTCVHRQTVKNICEHTYTSTCNTHTNMHAYMHNGMMCTYTCTSTPHMQYTHATPTMHMHMH